MEKYTITLSDGTKLRDLSLNGNNFISKARVITEDIFDFNLSPVMIGDEEHEQMALVQIQEHEDGYYFILRDLSQAEKAEAKMKSDIEYIAMVSGIELEEV